MSKLQNELKKRVFKNLCGQIKYCEVEIASLLQITTINGGVIPVLETTLKNSTQFVNLKEDQNKINFKDHIPGNKIMIQNMHFGFWSNFVQNCF